MKKPWTIVQGNFNKISFVHYFIFIYFYIDTPVLNVNAIATCNGIQVEGEKDNDTVIMATVKDSLNHTVLQCNISALPYLINYTVLPPDIEFNTEFVGVNPAGAGESLEQAVSFENCRVTIKTDGTILFPLFSDIL